MEGWLDKVTKYAIKIIAQNKSVTMRDIAGADERQHDIALIKLQGHVDLQKFAPVCLPKKAKKWEGKNAWAVGWGVAENS